MTLDALAKLVLVVLWAAGAAVVLGALGFRF
jgi:hypothetical protein